MKKGTKLNKSEEKLLTMILGTLKMNKKLEIF